MTPAEAPYQRVVREIVTAVRTGRLKPGDAVPGAPGLGEQHGVSKATAQKAINALKDLGVLESVVGVGITVTAKPPPEDVTLGALATTVREHQDQLSNQEDRISALEMHLQDLADRLGQPRPKSRQPRNRRTS